jgi:hypothetical protein
MGEGQAPMIAIQVELDKLVKLAAALSLHPE